MNKINIVVALLFLAGCAEGAESGSNSIVALGEEPAGENCSEGGQRISSGLDDGDPGGVAGDGVLQADEVDQTSVVCNGTAPSSSLTSVSDEEAGDNCASGGSRVSQGLDNGDGEGTADNDELEAGEVDTNFFICAGEDGQAGKGGTTTLLTVSPESAGGDCPLGGQRIDSGLDNGDGGGNADDGALQVGEIDGTSYVCNATGNALVSISAVSSGLAGCAVGGHKIDTGVDDGDGGEIAGNGILEAGEVDSTTFVCTSAQVGKYYLLGLTRNIIFAEQACEDQGMVLATWGSDDDIEDMLAVCDLGPKQTQSFFPSWACYTQFKVQDGAPVSYLDGAAMPPLPSHFWDFTPPSSWLEGRAILINQNAGGFMVALSFGYPICMHPLS